MSLYLTDDKSTLVQIMAWCLMAPSHYLSHCWSDNWRHMASLGHNELTCLFCSGFLVGYNSLCANASVNHLHVHAWYSAEPLYIQTAVSDWMSRTHQPLTYGDWINLIRHSKYHGCWCPGSLHRQDISTHDTDYVLHSQYHGCWCPGDARSQGISNHDIYYVLVVCRIGKFLAYLRKVFNYLYHVNLEEWQKM